MVRAIRPVVLCYNHSVVYGNCYGMCQGALGICQGALGIYHYCDVIASSYCAVLY